MSNKYCAPGGAGITDSINIPYLLDRGDDVIIYDNLSHRGVNTNIDWLHQKFGSGSFQPITGYIRDSTLLTSSVQDVDVIIHLASQVSIASSV